jgi:hypothetical protein
MSAKQAYVAVNNAERARLEAFVAQCTDADLAHEMPDMKCRRGGRWLASWRIWRSGTNVRPYYWSLVARNTAIGTPVNLMRAVQSPGASG